MVITKDKLQDIIDHLPQEVEVGEVIDKILLKAKIDQALRESEEGLGQDWDDFKKEWLQEE